MNNGKVAPMSNGKKWAIVTGGSRGLGYETAKGLIAAGFFVYFAQMMKSGAEFYQ